MTIILTLEEKVRYMFCNAHTILYAEDTWVLKYVFDVWTISLCLPGIGKTCRGSFYHPTDRFEVIRLDTVEVSTET